MTPEERERMIRSNSMTANERFLIGLLDEALAKIERVEQLAQEMLQVPRGELMPVRGGGALIADALVKES